MKRKKLQLSRETIQDLQNVGGGVSARCDYSRAFSNCPQSCILTCYTCPV